MQQHNSRIAKNTFFLYFRMFVTMAVSLYTVRVVLKALSVQDYGLYSAVGGIILTFNFISSVLTNASQRFFSFELGKQSDSQITKVFSTIFIIYLIVSAIIIVLAESLGLWFLENKMTIPIGRESAAMWVYQFALLSFLTTILTTPYRAMIIAQEKMNLYAYLSIFDAVSKLLIAYLIFAYNGDKLKFYAVLMFVFHFINNIIYYAYCRNKYHETRFIWHFDGDLFKSIFSYSSWTLFGTIAGMCNTQGVNIILNLFFGPVANAAYSIASQIYHTVGTFANNFYVAVKPPLIKNYASQNFGYVNKLFTFSSKALFSLLCLLAVPLIVCTEEILQLWLDQVGDYMVSFVKLSLFYVIVITISYPITAIVQAGGNVKLYHSLVDGFSLLVLPIVYLLFKLGFDAYWAYIVSVGVFSIAHGLRIYVLKRVFPLFNINHYLIGSIFPMIIILLISNILMLYLKYILPDDLWINIIVFILSALLVLVLCMLFLFNKNERLMVQSLIKDMIKKKK